jgi:hypothetical protein
VECSAAGQFLNARARKDQVEPQERLSVRVPRRAQALHPAASVAPCTPRASIQTVLRVRVRECRDGRALALPAQVSAGRRVSERLRQGRRIGRRVAINSGAERAIDTRNPKKVQ